MDPVSQALADLQTLSASQPANATPVTAADVQAVVDAFEGIDLDMIRQILPLLAIIFPQYASFIPIIEKFLDIFGRFFTPSPGASAP